MGEIAGIVASIVGPAVDLRIRIAEPIKRQFNYLCCFYSNVENLRDEAKKLDDARALLQMQVDIAKCNAEVIAPEVETWLKDFNEIQEMMAGIESEIWNMQGGCLNVKSRFLLSRKVKKITEVVKELRYVCNFSYMSVPSSASMVSIPSLPTYDEFGSRKQIEEEIMTTLKDKKANMIGICGMGGIGKTTMAQRIMRKAMEEHLFDEVVMVVISQKPEKLRIQLEIAELLGLRLEEETLLDRAQKLRARLTGTKRILLVLDDVWKSLSLKDLGIPCETGSNGCTTLLTSRDRGVLSAMDVQKICEVQILSESEASLLFKRNAGTCLDDLDDLDLLSTAKQVAKECNGLPIAIITIGRLLKDKRDKLIWEHALKQLKSSNPTDMPDVLAKVYKPLKLSYDFLDNEHARYIFLLCCLFPEDHDIPLEYLTFYSMGLGMFEGIKEARDKTCRLVEMLKSCFLLLDGYDEHHVKMHDIVRDVATFFALEEGLRLFNFSSMDWSREQSYNDYTWVSFFLKGNDELPMGLILPKLRLLLIDNLTKKKAQVDDESFEGMRSLDVLSIKSISLPPTIQLLNNLGTLLLHSCTLETICVVGELLSLEILSFRHCDLIGELPVEIGKINRLKLLEISDCQRLQTIAPGVISSLVRLEELKIVNSFRRWEKVEKGKERKNAALSELESLSNLTCLQIEIEDWTLAAERIKLSSNVVKYDIKIPTDGWVDMGTHERNMHLKLETGIILGHWIHIFLKNSEDLYLKGDGLNCLDLAQAESTMLLHLEKCSTMKKVVNVTKAIDWTFGVFPLLECLWLEELDNLEEICNGLIPQGSDSFGRLKKITIKRLPALKHLWKSPNQKVSLCNVSSIHIWLCNNLRDLFSLGMAKDSLLQLERLKISCCEMMEKVLWSEDTEKDGENQIVFPKLKTLNLNILPELTSFCKGIEKIEFPMLTEMEIEDCPKLTSVVSSAGNTIQLAEDGHNDDFLHLFCKPKVAFSNLKSLRIRGYDNIRNTWCHQIPIGFFSGLEKVVIVCCSRITNLFSSSMAEDLVNLKELTIGRCPEMLKVIEDEEKVWETSPFHKLKLLELNCLPKLDTFCAWRCALELPSLKQVWIKDCPRMKSFSSGSLTSLNLARIEIETRIIDDTTNLNCALQRYFRANDLSRPSETISGEEEGEARRGSEARWGRRWGRRGRRGPGARP